MSILINLLLSDVVILQVHKIHTNFNTWSRNVIFLKHMKWNSTRINSLTMHLKWTLSFHHGQTV